MENNRPNSLVSVGLTPDQEDRAWELYEKCGNMAEVARTLNVHYHHIYHCLNRDPIRLHDIQRVRADGSAATWEEVESKTARASVKLLGFLTKIIQHVEACEETGAETDLVNQYKGTKMSPVEAMQWLLTSRQLDGMLKGGFTAAQTAIALRSVSTGGMVGRKSTANGERDPGTMSDAELRQLVNELEASGKPLPYGVQQWKDGQTPSLPGRGPDGTS